MDLKVDNEKLKVIEKSSIENIIAETSLENKKDIMAVIIENEVYDLTEELDRDAELKTVNIASELGNRIYRRSLYFVMAKAIYELFPETILKIEISISNGIYCELENKPSLSKSDLNKLKKRMQEIIDADYKIKKHKLKKEKVLEIIAQENCAFRRELLEQQDKDYYTLYELDGYYDYFYYNMVPSTSYLKKFGLHLRIPGFVLLFPKFFTNKELPKFKEQPKLANVFLEYERLGKILGVNNVAELNQCIEANEYNELIRIAEALHEKKIAEIADRIKSGMPRNKIILIAGPSSSGKTTFTHRLSTQLKINGLRPVQISGDNYFVNRENTPLDENGEPDFESIEAINLELFNNHLLQLIQGEEVELPKFNFEKGIRENSGKFLKLDDDQPILIEGIHGLNDIMTEVIPQDLKFKIYISALTQLNIDCHNRIPTTDTRLIRRVVRDNQYRGLSAADTLNLWQSVRRGEEENIFPYQENADVMFNSALIYELSVLKNYVEPLLKQIDKTNKNYHQAQRLLEILSNFKAIPDNEVPFTSILREFTGMSVFREK
ncbi:MAG: uridine kinase [Halanaerobium sp. 4-GBenrich]|jgi:uridine kinase|uniref:Uridine kinase n=1 Tax=Halanaerobium congolense TaxID=54121 RepID=A0A1G6HS04_9FIRM|nr:nucleoside kinase [Halanaerobium congolense]KXS50064.1 MAG: uridine kinase [Halanaerobium sp. T82-1]ODS50251.1 MAG: uridine kinase [Halanaerobium sp. 4-GBenrich]OEG63580.1 MAG: AAA family ATPase [Halanaerobium sp. MDAL1]PUU92929.1 MAG: uridine kinase [Halanaerobium sp.]PTX16940.1 uridine kinase [Halanaerobium congolense]